MWIDVAALVVLGLFGVLGYMRGLFSQAWSLGSLLVSFFGAAPMLRFVQARLGTGRDESLLGDWVLKLVAGLALYVGLLIIGYAIEKFFLERFKLVNATNRLLGGALGAAKGTVGVLVGVWILSFMAPLVPAKESSLRAAVEVSRVARMAEPYNPLNLLRLSRIKPYLPQTITGMAPTRPPKTLSDRETFRALMTNQAFLDAYRNHDYTAILRNPAFRRFIQDGGLLSLLEKNRP